MEKSIYFLAEKDGNVERKFKDELVEYFLQTQNPIRAYLLLIQYDNESSCHVMLAIRVPLANESLISNCSAIFKSMFWE
jgi:hypothetical protein